MAYNLLRSAYFIFLILSTAMGFPNPALLILHNAKIFTMEPNQIDPFTGYIVISQSGIISEIGTGEPDLSLYIPEQVVDLEGKWILPGFISAHSHIWQSAFRGLAADSTLSDWIHQLYSDEVPGATDEDIFWFVLHGSLDHIRNGITTAYNFNLGNVGTNRSFEELRAEILSGMRFFHGFNLNSRLDYADLKKDVDEFQRLANYVHASPNNLGLAVNVNGAFSNSSDEISTESKVMHDFGFIGQIHYLEEGGPTAIRDQQEKFAWIEDSKLLNNYTIFGHFIHTNSTILSAAVNSEASMSWNPLSNGRLGSGIADIPLYLKNGLRIGMGVDGQASADLVDPFSNMRYGLYAVRDLYSSANVITPYDVVRLHTIGSASVLGVADKIGSLKEGKLADLIVINPIDYGHIFDYYASLVFVTNIRQLDRVYIGGKLQSLKSDLINFNWEEISREVSSRVDRINVAQK
jgi:cytosine/adenosine deaminase-related metal-dependent hydrolase